MYSEEIIQKTSVYVKEKLFGEFTGHDWWHTYRVWKTSVYIAKQENADLFTVELAALFHDLYDWKFFQGNLSAGLRLTEQWLRSAGVDEKTVLHVSKIISEISYKGASEKAKPKTTEGKVVQDADRLDAIGAIGIARAFAYGGFKGRVIHDPDICPQMHRSFEEYKNSAGTSVNHFHEKLFLLKNLMNTAIAKKMAKERHRFMEQYLKQFHKEWNFL